MSSGHENPHQNNIPLTSCYLKNYPICPKFNQLLFESLDKKEIYWAYSSFTGDIIVYKDNATSPSTELDNITY